jgi:hypothetical protein
MFPPHHCGGNIQAAPFKGKTMKQPMPRLVCNDGFSMSVQASQGNYCSPREDKGPYEAVEVGFPSQEEPLLTPFAENREQLTNTAYGWVPTKIVEQVIAAHGGINIGRTLDY